MQAAAPAAAFGAARFQFFIGDTCSPPSLLTVPAWLGLCTPLGKVGFAAYTVQLKSCALADASSGGNVTGVAHFLPASFLYGRADDCQSSARLEFAFTAMPGSCVPLPASSKASLRMLGAPTCAPTDAASVFLLESFDPSSKACDRDDFDGHQALPLGACVAGGYVPPGTGRAVNVSVALVAGGAALRVTQYDNSPAGCSGAPSRLLPALPDLALPAAGSGGVGACNRSGSTGSSLPSFRLLAPVVMPSASASPSVTPSPTFSRGASPSASPTTSATATPTVGGGGGGGGGDAAPAALPLLTPTTIIAMSVSIPVGLLLLLAVACALRRLSARSITWSKDAETVIVQSPMRPSIYRPTVKLPEASVNSSASSAKTSTWGYV